MSSTFVCIGDYLRFVGGGSILGAFAIGLIIEIVNSFSIVSNLLAYFYYKV